MTAKILIHKELQKVTGVTGWLLTLYVYVCTIDILLILNLKVRNIDVTPVTCSLDLTTIDLLGNRMSCYLLLPPVTSITHKINTNQNQNQL